MERKYEFDDNYPEYDFNEDGKVTIEDVAKAPEFLLQYLAGSYLPNDHDDEIMEKFRDNSRRVVESHVSGDITIQAVTDAINLRYFFEHGQIEEVSDETVAIGKKIFVNDDFSKKYNISINGREPQPLARQVFVVDGIITVERRIANTDWQFKTSPTEGQNGQWEVNFTSNGQSFNNMSYAYDAENLEHSIYFGGTLVYGGDSQTWVNSNYRDIHIIDGENILSESFVNFLDRNATFKS